MARDSPPCQPQLPRAAPVLYTANKEAAVAYTAADTDYDNLVFRGSRDPVNVLRRRALQPHGDEALSRLRWHEQMEVKYFRCGGAQIELNAEKIIAQDGDIVVVNPCVRHGTAYLYGSPEYDILYIDLRYAFDWLGDAARESFLPLVQGRAILPTLIQGDDRTRGLLLALLDEAEDVPDSVPTRGLLAAFLSRLLADSRTRLVEPADMENIRKYSQLLEPAFALISAEYTKPLRVSALAAACGVSEQYFCKIFKLAAGMPASRYILRQRLGKAAVLLQVTDLRVGEVARAAGFSDSLYFSRCFSRERGASPSAFRRK